MPLDPRVALLLARATALDPRPMETLGVVEARARGGSLPSVASVPFEDVAEVRDLLIDGTTPARLYRPAADAGALVVYFHGGGWVLGSVALSDGFCRALANASGCAVLSVEYRLAPEHRYPTAVEDAYRATAWAAANASKLGLEKLAVAGSSAGGNLAAVVSLMARERGPRIALQVLHVPVADHDLDTRSYHAYGSGHGLTRDGMRWFWDHYLPDRARRAEPQASPLRAADLRELPPAIVVTAECDPLHDEGVAYATRLRSSGVPVTHLDYEGMVHGFMGWSSELPQARRAFDEIGAAMREALDTA